MFDRHRVTQVGQASGGQQRHGSRRLADIAFGRSTASASQRGDGSRTAPFDGPPREHTTDLPGREAADGPTREPRDHALRRVRGGSAWPATATVMPPEPSDAAFRRQLAGRAHSLVVATRTGASAEHRARASGAARKGPLELSHGICDSTVKHDDSTSRTQAPSRSSPTHRAGPPLTSVSRTTQAGADLAPSPVFDDGRRGQTPTRRCADG